MHTILPIWNIIHKELNQMNLLTECLSILLCRTVMFWCFFHHSPDVLLLWMRSFIYWLLRSNAFAVFLCSHLFRLFSWSFCFLSLLLFENSLFSSHAIRCLLYLLIMFACVLLFYLRNRMNALNMFFFRFFFLTLIHGISLSLTLLQTLLDTEQCVLYNSICYSILNTSTTFLIIERKQIIYKSITEHVTHNNKTQ